MEQSQPAGPRLAGLARRVAPDSLLRAAQAIKRRRRHRLEPRLGCYSPVSTLHLQPHEVPAACTRAIEFHAHLGRWLTNDGTWMTPDVGALIEVMDRCNIEAMVNLDGRWGSELEKNLDRYDRRYPGRFHSFCHVDWRLLEERHGTDRIVASLRRSVETGARGLKVWKDLGMSVRVRDRLVMLDDPLVAPVWEAAAELGIPVLIHVADPEAFFLPVDRYNERLEELLRTPDAARPGGLAEYRRLLDSFEAMVTAQPRTRVVAAHAICPENLPRVSELLSRCPNLSIDIGWRAGDLGRQPRAARELLVEHSDRVLFGTDALPPRATIYSIFFRFLETDDESFAYSDEPTPPCGRWDIHGLDLPRAALERIYRTNALQLLGMADSDEGRRSATSGTSTGNGANGNGANGNGTNGNGATGVGANGSTMTVGATRPTAREHGGGFAAPGWDQLVDH